MKHLLEQHINYIEQIVNNSKIESSEMKEDLIDHFCCAIEEQMKNGLSFEKSYQKAYMNICPDGLDSIQKEAVFLITTKKSKTFKLLTYLSGYLSVFGITLSLFMKSFHIEGANIAVLISSVICILFFLPMLFFNLYKRKISRILSESLIYIFGFLSIILLFTFFTFLMFHWPGAMIILLSSILIINLAFLPLFLFKKYKKQL